MTEQEGGIDMRAHEFITEDQKRRPEISLRHLNHLKHIGRARAASHARRAALVRTMYANPAREHQRIEFEKARLDLEQQKAELAATRAEARAQAHEAITDMTSASSKADQPDPGYVLICRSRPKTGLVIAAGRRWARLRATARPLETSP